MRGGRRGRFKVQDAAEIQHRHDAGIGRGRLPREIQAVAVGVAGEAVIEPAG